MRLCAAAALTAEYMTDRSIALNVPVLEDYLEAFRMRDLCRCTELYAEGAILEFGGTYCRDKPCLERWHRERFASNLDLLRIDSVLVNGNVVTVDGVVMPVEEQMSEGRVDEDRLADLQARARTLHLWTPQLPPEWGGLGAGPLCMALVNQELGASAIAPLVLNCAPPNEANMLLLQHAASPEQKERYLRPLAAGQVRSCFAMSEKAAGSDLGGIKTRASPEGNHWVLNGEKWFIGGARTASFAVVVAITNANVPAQQGMTLFLVDTDTPGWEVVREIPSLGTRVPGGPCEVRSE